MNIRQLCVSGLFGLTVCASQAATITTSTTYVDATDANTTGNGTPPSPSGGNVYGDNLWSLRSGLNATNDAVGGNVFEAGPEPNQDNPTASNTESAPLLTTTITGLTAGTTYSLFAYFASQDGPGNVTTDQIWQIRAGLNSNSLIFFNSNNAVGTGAGQIERINGQSFANSVTAPANRNYYQASLGTAVADSFGTLQIFVDNAPVSNPVGNNNNGTYNRSWYDGVGFEAVPEPSTALLGLVGGMTFLLRRRR